MENSKLWKLCQQLPPGNWAAIRKWLASPYYNQKVQLPLLWRYLQSCLKAEACPVPSEAFRSMYPEGEGLDKVKLRLAMSDLYRQLLAFLVTQERQEEHIRAAMLESRSLRRLNLSDLSEKRLEKGLRELEKQPLRNNSYLRERYELLAERYRHFGQSSPTDSSALQSLNDAADLALVAAKLKQACLSIAHQTVYTASPEMGFTEQVLAYARSAHLVEEPAVGLYYHCFLMLSEPDQVVHYRLFKKALLGQLNHFPQREIRELLLMAINYCIRQVNRGNEGYFEEITALYRIGLREDYLLENGQLSRFTYYNIVAAGLRSEDYNWVGQFIRDYRPTLPKLYRESSFSFCLARLHYAQNQYEVALPLLQKANYRDPLLNLAAKTLLLKIYYESGEHDALQAHLDAMENYIRRKKVIGYHRKNYQNIVRFSRLLITVNPYAPSELDRLIRQIDEEEVLTERQWLRAAVRVLGRDRG